MYQSNDNISLSINNERKSKVSLNQFVNNADELFFKVTFGKSHYIGVIRFATPKVVNHASFPLIFPLNLQTLPSHNL